MVSARRHSARIQKNHLLGGIVKKVKAVWPKAHEQYLVGLPKAVQTTDYYYRDYDKDTSPFTDVVEEQERLNLVVIGESHARTNPATVGKQILPHFQGLVPKKYRKGHINLVHCLSYGETWLAGIDDKGANAGTHQFWKLQRVLGGTDEEITEENFKGIFAPLLKEGTDGEERVRLKCSIMDQMERRKIKLVDMTPAYIYLAAGTVERPSQKKAKGTYTDRKATIKGKPEKAIIQYSWEHYIKPYLESHRPHNVVILGKSLNQLIGESEICHFLTSIGANYQGTHLHPSAHLLPSQRIAELNKMRQIANDSQMP
jgi:hypothetical protein